LAFAAFRPQKKPFYARNCVFEKSIHKNSHFCGQARVFSLLIHKNALFCGRNFDFWQSIHKNALFCGWTCGSWQIYLTNLLISEFSLLSSSHKANVKMIGAAEQPIISAKSFWRTALKTSH